VRLAGAIAAGTGGDEAEVIVERRRRWAAGAMAGHFFGEKANKAMGPSWFVHR
jgi:hypothetical protein